MKPVLSSTGALRLEDVKGQTLLLQIANKSMLMDQKAGRRVVDGCVHEKQKAAALAAASRWHSAPQRTGQAAGGPFSLPRAARQSGVSRRCDASLQVLYKI